MNTSTWIAFAAFIVAVATFYLTLLRPAEIELDHAPASTEMPVSLRGGIPLANELRVSIYASNLGAHGGLLTSVDVRDFQVECSGPAFWSGLATWDLRHHDNNALVEFPIVIQAGDFKTLRLRCFPNEMVHDLDITDRQSVASSIGALRAVSFEVEWSFVRTSGLPLAVRWLPRPLRRHRSSKRRKQRIRIDASRFRRDTIQQWRRLKDTADLADAAESIDRALTTDR